ncbi:MAG: radical SAM/SPASM domain-containing protein [Deltaproteobacteria bacterium]|nr:radical SAM/SPASM domain-containing protein [Deltaproteobacteria bacterium]
MKRRKFRLFQIEPTTRCNLHCVMCPWKDLHRSGRDMDLDLYEALSKDFIDVEEVDLTGSGEPLMNEALDQMVRIAKDSGCRVGFSTNGVLLTPDRLDKLLAAGLDWVAFSVDAATSETYKKIRVGASFEDVLDNLEYIKSVRNSRNDRCPSLMIFFVMMKANYFELPDMVELASELDVNFLVAKNQDVIVSSDNDLNRVFGLPDAHDLTIDVSRVIEDAKQRAARLKLNLRVYELAASESAICEQNPLRTLFVSADGFLSPCISLAYMNHRYFDGKKVEIPVYRFGNLKETSLGDIVESKDYVAFRRLFENRLSVSIIGSIKSFLLDPNSFPRSRNFSLPPIGCRTCYYLYGI